MVLVAGEKENLQPKDWPCRQQGQAGNGTVSYYQGQAPHSNLGIEIQTNKELRAQLHVQNMQIGYGHNQLQITFEVIEQKFLNKILKLSRELSNAEDAEIARHGEKIIEINTKYQEKLEALRTRQANRREEFLRNRKASQAWLQHQQQGRTSQFQNTGVLDGHSYGGTAVASTAGEGHRAHIIGQFKYPGSGRTQGSDSMVQYYRSMHTTLVPITINDCAS